MKKINLIIITICFTWNLTYAQFSTSGSNIYYNSGNVGIGTTSPSTPLQVNGTILSLTPIGNTAIIGTTALGNLSYNFIGYQGYWGLRTASNLSYNFDVYNGGTPITAMTILQNGNIGIATTDPQGYKLAVNGNAIATSMTVKLNSAWPDYVFKPTYHLPSLTEVKTYIDLHQHLPDMPSEAEVAKDGLNLGEMNKLLVKKVEELTLYLIDKDKKEAEQQKTNESLQVQINDLVKQLKKITTSTK